jgi:septum formation protein
MTPRLILASGSEARASVLRAAGIAFLAHAAEVDEAAIKQDCRKRGDTAEATALALAKAKRDAVALFYPDDAIIGADQLLECRGEWFDKPQSLDEAGAHLRRLRGRRHRLVTAIAARCPRQPDWQHVETPLLIMRQFSDAFLQTYLAREGGALLSSVGAYRIEGMGIQLFDTVEGHESAILGLPILPLLAWLRRCGLANP